MAWNPPPFQQQNAQQFGNKELFGVSTKYRTFFKKPYFILAMDQNQSADNSNHVKEFNENLKNEAFEGSFKFKLTKDRNVWIEKNLLRKSGLFVPSNKSQTEWDLSIISEICGSESEQIIMKPLQLCCTGFIKLSEQKEMTQFLLASFLLQIAKPFEYIINVLPIITSETSIQLQDQSEILDIDLFLQSCEGNQMYSEYVQPSKTNQILNGLKIYQDFLKRFNSQYYLSSQLNPQTGMPSFHPKLEKYKFNQFTDVFLNELGQLLFPYQENNFYTFENVQFFHSAIVFYIKSQDAPGTDKDVESNIQKAFEVYYPNIQSNLSEADSMACLQFFTSDKNIILQQLKQKKLELKVQKEQETALSDMLFAQCSQNMILQQAQMKYYPQRPNLTGAQIRQQMEQDIQYQIAYLKQQGYV